MRRDGFEQLNTELFLRSAPGFLRWVLRLFVLQDVVDRYYDLRRVVIDLIANLYKEGRVDLVPVWLETANRFLAKELAAAGLKPINEQEMIAYYRRRAHLAAVPGPAPLDRAAPVDRPGIPIRAAGADPGVGA